jgi:hypothetical protein
MTKRLEIEDDDNPFLLRPWDPPVGTIYGWFRAYDGSSEDRERIEKLVKSGWMPVPAHRHDGRWMPKGHPGPVQLYGMVLMERAEIVH